MKKIGLAVPQFGILAGLLLLASVASAQTDDLRPMIESKLKSLETAQSEMEQKIEKLKADPSPEAARKVADLKVQAAESFDEYAVAKAVLSTYNLVEEPITSKIVEERVSELTTEIAALESKRTRSVASEQLSETIKSRNTERGFWKNLQAGSNAPNSKN